jgi:diguanylate cyclase (GGDEF)-like protein
MANLPKTQSWTKVATPESRLTVVDPPLEIEDFAAAVAADTAGSAEDTLRAIRAGEIDAFVVSDHKSQKRVFALERSDRPYRWFVENMRDAAATVSAAGQILYANQRFAELLLSTRESVTGSRLSQYLAPGTAIGDVWKLAGGESSAEVDLIDQRGAPVPTLMGTSVLKLDENPLYCITFTDLRAQRLQADEIQRLSDIQSERLVELESAKTALTIQATHDMLTGLPNRMLLVDRIDRAIENARRNGSCVCVMYLDIDGFKQINDTQGHAAGDAAIKCTASRLLEALRPMDTVARIGGDEFVVLAPEVDSSVHAIDLGNRLLARLAEPSDCAYELHYSASVGVTVTETGESTPELMLTEADAAMYVAKSLGGGRVEVFGPALQERVLERAATHRNLQSALAEDRVTAHFQPIIGLQDGAVVGFEALARITQMDGSILQPAAFVPFSEENGLIIPLGERILNFACEQASNWPKAEPALEGRSIAVNLSGRQFDSGKLPGLVREALDRSGLDPTLLHLELTETSVIDLRPDVIDQLTQIREMGVELGLDDFGTGYASLTHLRRLPLTFVKIDRSFVSGLGVERGDSGIVAAVVEIASVLELRSIAEGVETEDQCARLKAMGCDQAQGFLYARPHPASEVPFTGQRIH